MLEALLESAGSTDGVFGAVLGVTVDHSQIWGHWKLCWRLLEAQMECLELFGVWMAVRFDVGTLGALLEVAGGLDGVFGG